MLKITTMLHLKFLSFNDLFKKKKSLSFYVGIYLINNVVLVSGEQQSDSVMHIHVSILF